MKLYFLVTALFATALLSAQTDTTFISIRQENTQPERQQFADAYQTMFRSLEPARFLFKWNALAVVPTGGDRLNRSILAFSVPAPPYSYAPRGPSLDFAAEGKITPWLSMNVGGGLISRHISPDLFLYDYLTKTLTYARVSAEPRVYFEMPRQIRSGQHADNMSGNYVGLEVSQSKLLGHSTEPVLYPERERTATIRFGVQRRLFKYGYFDLSYGLGWRSWDQKMLYQQNNPSSAFFANSRVAVGFALAAGTRKQEGQAASWCDITRCYREENQMLRIDLLNALMLDNVQELHGELPVAYERKIAESAFSVETEARLTYGRSHVYRYVSVSDNPINWAGGGLALEPRFYFNLKKRIASGRSGNNLSGPFIGLRALGLLQYAHAPAGLDFELTTKQVAVLPVIGIQYRILRNGFIAYKAGFGPSITKESGLIQNAKGEDVYWLSELKVGLAF